MSVSDVREPSPDSRNEKKVGFDSHNMIVFEVCYFKKPLEIRANVGHESFSPQPGR